MGAPNLEARVRYEHDLAARVLDSTDRDVSELIESFMTTFAPVIEDFAASEPPIDLDGAADIFSDYATDLLNAQQRDTLERLGARLNSM